MSGTLTGIRSIGIGQLISAAFGGTISLASTKSLNSKRSILISSSCEPAREGSDVGDEAPRPRRWRWLLRSPWRACGIDRATRTCVRPPIGGEAPQSRGFVGTFDDFDVPSSKFGQRIAKLVAGIAAIGEDMTQPRIERAAIDDRTDGAVAILDVGGVNLQADQMALRVGDDVALAALDLLACIKAAWTAAFRGLHRLAVDHTGATGSPRGPPSRARPSPARG